MISEETYKYFSMCEHPRTVLNKYTGELIQVECGVCPHCVLKKYGKMSSMCASHGLTSNYCYFITLTYRDTAIPKMRCYLQNNEYDYVIDDDGRFWSTNRISYTPLSMCSDDVEGDFMFILDPVDLEDSETDPEMFIIHSNTSYLKKLCLKCKLGPDTFAYLRYRDVQLFLKRLRKKFQKLYNEKITFFCAGEYGPKSFRPHFHLLLYSNRRTVFSNYARLIHKIWSYGRTDSQLSRGSAGSYTAGYVNSVVSLPYLFKANSLVKPKCRRSQHFAERLHQPLMENPQEEIDFAIAGRDVVIDGNVLSIRPPRALINRLFPRFGQIPPSDIASIVQLLLSTNQALRRLVDYDPSLWLVNTPTQYARVFMRYLSDLDCYPDLDTYSLLNHIRLGKNTGLDEKGAFSRIYRFFLKIQHFFKSWNIGSLSDFPPYHILVRTLLFVSEYYDKLSRFMLRTYYDMCETFDREVSPHLPDCEDVKLYGFVSLSSSHVTSLKSIRAVTCQFGEIIKFRSHAMLSRKTKHKELNDENSFFIYNS